MLIFSFNQKYRHFPLLRMWILFLFFYVCPSKLHVFFCIPQSIHFLWKLVTETRIKNNKNETGDLFYCPWICKLRIIDYCLFMISIIFATLAHTHAFARVITVVINRIKSFSDDFKVELHSSFLWRVIEILSNKHYNLWILFA